MVIPLNKHRDLMHTVMRVWATRSVFDEFGMFTVCCDIWGDKEFMSLLMDITNGRRMADKLSPPDECAATLLYLIRMDGAGVVKNDPEGLSRVRSAQVTLVSRLSAGLLIESGLSPMDYVHLTSPDGADEGVMRQLAEGLEAVAREMESGRAERERAKQGIS